MSVRRRAQAATVSWLRHWRQRAVVAEAVADLSHWALQASQPDELLREALRVAVRVIGADYGTAVRRLPDGRLRVAQELGPQPLAPGTDLELAPEGSYALHVVDSGQPFVSPDLRSDPRVTPPEPLLSRGVVSGLVVPVRGADAVLGLLALHSRHRRRFRRQDVATAGALASVVATAWEQLAQRERLRDQALHDALTGLPNRTLFLERLDAALADSADDTGVAVLLLDLDDFQGVNDSFGHAAGDHLLGVAARRLAALVPPEHTLARLGGDEFGVLCQAVPDEAGVVELARRMQAACAEPVVVGALPVTLSADVGIAWSRRTPAARRGAVALLSDAGTALYRAKDQGRGSVQVFDHRLQRATRLRRQLEAELQAALRRGEFRLRYQPVRRSSDLRAVGVEALVTWQHPSRGLLLPDDFLPVAEPAGLLVPLGAWVLRTACRQVARWQRDLPDPLWLAVNVSPRQLDDPWLPDTVAEAVRDSGLAAGTLALELTESALLAGADNHRESLGQLRSTGAALFLDDFGTGFSSLTHLTELPISAVKIDRSFVAGVPGSARESAVVSSLITLSAALDLDVIAEGVETVEQLAALRELGCPALQGYLLDRPTAEPAFAALRLPI